MAKKYYLKAILIVTINLCVVKTKAIENNKRGQCPPTPPYAGVLTLCNKDSDCTGAKKCCVTELGQSCTEPLMEPIILWKHGTCPRAPKKIGNETHCQFDIDCEERKKCCLTTIGRSCEDPIDKPANKTKEGTCPNNLTETEQNDVCLSDDDCEGSEKCCYAKVGHICAKPIVEHSGIPETTQTPTTNRTGFCPPEPAVTGKAKFCSNDNNCDGSKKCCLTHIGFSCVEPLERNVTQFKSGSCPPSPSVIGTLIECLTDDQCEEGNKCCATEYGASCVAPVWQKFVFINIIEKDASCPVPSLEDGLTSVCKTDYDCEGVQKCCRTKAGNLCMKAKKNHARTKKPGACPSQPPYKGNIRLCDNDFDCPGKKKCCPSQLGVSCRVPRRRQQDAMTIPYFKK